LISLVLFWRSESHSLTFPSTVRVFQYFCIFSSKNCFASGGVASKTNLKTKIYEMPHHLSPFTTKQIPILNNKMNQMVHIMRHKVEQRINKTKKIRYDRVGMS
jgi:hypothetical protein